MTIHQKLAAGFVVLAIVNLGLQPDFFASSIAALASVFLYGFTVFIERRDSEHMQALTKRITDLDSKVQSLMIARGLGR